MRTRPTLLRKTCPLCGGPSYAEAKLPISSSVPVVEYNLDDLGALVEKQSLSLLLALVELLPYKTFVCRKCRGEFRMENQAAKEMARAMLATMKPVIPEAKPKRASPARPAARPTSAPTMTTAEKPEQKKGDWEAESLDSLFDYSVEPTKK
jgi:hypothetical protein